MDTVTSTDGTRIAFWSSGSGPALLLIHGGMADHSRWADVSAPLEEHFTVYTMDRRGRGSSEDGAAYSMQRECEDVVAVVDSIGGLVTVLGHSYGGNVALGAALLTDRIERLIVYEPGVLESATGHYTSDHMAAALRKAEAQIAEGDQEGAVVTVFTKIVGVPDKDVEAMKSMPSWPGRVAAAHTIPRELQAHGAWKFDPDDYKSLKIPTLLLSGTESEQIARDGTSVLHDALPNSRVVAMEGQGHIAMTTAPDLFVREVIAFMKQD